MTSFISTIIFIITVAALMKYINKKIKNKQKEKRKEAFIQNKKQRTKENYINAEKKGKEYEEYIAEHFRKKGYYVWEHGKEKGVKDNGVDLLIKKENTIYFVQCKNWENWKLDHNAVQAIQTKIRNFLKQEESLRKICSGYEQKILYVTSKECLTPGAYKYIKENKNILEYQTIPII